MHTFHIYIYLTFPYSYTLISSINWFSLVFFFDSPKAIKSAKYFSPICGAL